MGWYGSSKSLISSSVSRTCTEPKSAPISAPASSLERLYLRTKEIRQILKRGCAHNRGRHAIFSHDPGEGNLRHANPALRRDLFDPDSKCVRGPALRRRGLRHLPGDDFFVAFGPGVDTGGKAAEWVASMIERF
jgi:hypothetical protein